MYESPRRAPRTGYESPRRVPTTRYKSPRLWPTTGYKSPRRWPTTGYKSPRRWPTTGYNFTLRRAAAAPCLSRSHPRHVHTPTPSTVLTLVVEVIWRPHISFPRGNLVHNFAKPGNLTLKIEEPGNLALCKLSGPGNLVQNFSNPCKLAQLCAKPGNVAHFEEFDQVSWTKPYLFIY